MRRTTDTEMHAVLQLDGPTRLSHFVKRVADAQVAWGLWKDSGWALMENDGGVPAFPVWPAMEYAKIQRIGEWSEYEPREIALTDFLDELLPKLAGRGIRLAVFPTPAGKGVTLASAELATLLQVELERY
jgi:hypothetical protein